MPTKFKPRSCYGRSSRDTNNLGWPVCSLEQRLNTFESKLASAGPEVQALMQSALEGSLSDRLRMQSEVQEDQFVYLRYSGRFCQSSSTAWLGCTTSRYDVYIRGAALSPAARLGSTAQFIIPGISRLHTHATHDSGRLRKRSVGQSESVYASHANVSHLTHDCSMQYFWPAASGVVG
eukprot:9040521-Pyramimonas_sp.AAC.2